MLFFFFQKTNLKCHLKLLGYSKIESLIKVGLQRVAHIHENS